MAVLGAALVTNLALAPAADRGGTSGPATGTPRAADLATTTADGAVGPTVTLGDRPLLGERTGLAAVVGASLRPYVLDLDGATLTPSRAAVDGADVRVTPIGLVWSGFNGGGLHLSSPGAPPRRLGDAGVYLGADVAGHAWLQVTAGGRTSTVRLDSPAAEPQRLDLPAGWAVLPDGRGGVVTSSGGTVYRVGTGGDTGEVAAGELVDASNGRALVRSCGAALACRFAVVDVASGVVRAGPAAPVPGVGVASLSPDGEWIVERDAGGDLRAVAVRGGASVALGPTTAPCLGRACTGAPSWSGDGPWAAWLVDATTIGFWRPGLNAARTVVLPDRASDGASLSLVHVSLERVDRVAALLPSG
jgi:hypothetical protein